MGQGIIGYMFGTKILEEKKSKFNGTLRVVRTWGLGTYIQSNGLTQSGGIMERIWVQTLKKIKNKDLKIGAVLVLGLGGGTVAKLIKKNWPSAKITGIDIDPVIVELGRKYLDLNIENVDVRIGDATKIPPGKFDLVIVDLFNGDNWPKKFEETDFLKHLRKNKLVIFNRLYYKEKKVETVLFGKILGKIFPNVEAFYPISNVMFLCS